MTSWSSFNLPTSKITTRKKWSHRRPHSNDHFNDGSDQSFKIITRQEGFTKGSGSYHCGPHRKLFSSWIIPPTLFLLERPPMTAPIIIVPAVWMVCRMFPPCICTLFIIRNISNSKGSFYFPLYNALSIERLFMNKNSSAYFISPAATLCSIHKVKLYPGKKIFSAQSYFPPFYQAPDYKMRP